MENIASNASSSAVASEVSDSISPAQMHQQVAVGAGAESVSLPASTRPDSTPMSVASDANKPSVSATDSVILDPNGLASSGHGSQQGTFNTGLVQGGQPQLSGDLPPRAIGPLGSNFVNQPNFHQAQNFAMHPFQQAFAQQNFPHGFAQQIFPI